MDRTKEKITPKSVSLGDPLLAIILATIVIVMFFQVVFRYIFNNSITWSEELVRYLFVWVTFLGAALCFKDQLNIGVDFFQDLLPEGARKLMVQFNLLIMLSFTIFLLVSGCCWLFVGGKSFGSSIPVPINIALYGALPTSSILIVYFLINRLKSNYNHK